MTLLKAQFIGSAIITLATFGVSLAVMYAVNLTGTLRVSEEGELYGLDLHEHGISAYPEYVISSLAAPSGMPKDLTVHGAVAQTTSKFSAVTSPTGD
jgi:Amt family ammonium transporter